MNLSRLLVYIAVTAVSTYLIRVIPLVAIQKKIENRFFRSFLYYVPYAVLAAMIMPAVFYISARSIDEVNVQTIMEKLGGGGHMNVAGAQLRDVTLGQARCMLKDVLMAQEEKGDEVKG